MHSISSARSLGTVTPSETKRAPFNAARISIAAIISYHVMLFALIFLRPDLDAYWRRPLTASEIFFRHLHALNPLAATCRLNGKQHAHAIAIAARDIRLIFVT